MKLLNFFFAFAVLSLAFSCEKEVVETIAAPEVSSLEGVSDGDLGIVFNESIEGLSEDELSAKYFSASAGEQFQFHKNYLTLEMYRELGIINEENYQEWELLPIEQAVQYENYLTRKEAKELEERFEAAVEADLKADCRYRCRFIPHPYWPSGAPIRVCSFSCTTNTVVLYEGNNATQDIVGIIDANQNKLVRFTNDDCCPNDEARSMQMWNMEQGQRVTVYDDSRGRTTDDWCRVTVNTDFNLVTINTFETSTSNSLYTQVYQYGGNLDGKVSSLRVSGN